MEIKGQLIFCAIAVVIFSISSSQSIAGSIPGPEDKIEPEPVRTIEQTEAPAIPEVCKTHNDCKDSERCLDDQCSDECEDFWCGDHGNCLIKNHAPACNFTDYSESEEESYCAEDDDCENDEKCNEEICTNMCEFHQCGLNEECLMVEHKPVCIPSVAISSRFEESSCTSNEDCEDFEKCDDSTCIDACYPNPCGAGTTCGRYHHKTICICDNNTIVAPQTECVRMVECFSDDDCTFSEECRETKCQDPCAVNPCGDNALCAGVYFHSAVCMCNDGFSGNPYVGCSIITPEN